MVMGLGTALRVPLGEKGVATSLLALLGVHLEDAGGDGDNWELLYRELPNRFDGLKSGHDRHHQVCQDKVKW